MLHILRAGAVQNASLQPQNDPDGTQPLTRAELHRLTLFKWRYALESYGFADREVDRLLFLAWLHATSRTSW